MRILIAIPTYNRAALLGPSLDSIAQLVVPAQVTKVEVSVIDNNCTDETEQVVRARQSDFRFPLHYEVESQQGLCFGRNRALALAQSFDHLVLLDDDICVHQEWLTGYCVCLERFQADCVVGPVYAKFVGNAPRFLTEKARDSLSSPYSLKGDKPLLLTERSAHEIPGCNFGFRVSAGNQIGGFNPDLDRSGDGLLAGGDFDFGHRLVASQQKVAYHPACGIDHIITNEKLTWAYLRRRWRGTGATIRRLGRRPLTTSRFIHLVPRIMKLCTILFLCRCLRSPKAYDLQLELDKWMGYVTGRA